MATDSHPATMPRRPSRARNVAFWVVQIITAAGFLFAALGKFSGAQVDVATFHAIGFGDWFRYLVGTLEIVGAVTLLIPRLAGLAGLAFVGLMVGALATQIVVVGNGWIMPLPLLVLSAVIAWGRRRSTAQLWGLVRRR